MKVISNVKREHQPQVEKKNPRTQVFTVSLQDSAQLLSISVFHLSQCKSFELV